MNIVFGKIITGILVAVLGLTGLSVTNPSTAALSGTPSPHATRNPQRINARLERVFARETKIVEHLGKLYDNADGKFAKAQKLIDKAKERGLDVSQVQAAFDAFKSALPKGRPFYEQAKSILNRHDGFDASGKVTDAEAAKETVKSVHEALSQFKDAMGGTLKALREAIKAFREAHPRPTATPTTGG
jgi:hypothetical protein